MSNFVSDSNYSKSANVTKVCFEIIGVSSLEFRIASAMSWYALIISSYFFWLFIVAQILFIFYLIAKLSQSSFTYYFSSMLFSMVIKSVGFSTCVFRRNSPSIYLAS